MDLHHDRSLHNHLHPESDPDHQSAHTGGKQTLPMVFPFRNHTYKAGHYNSFSSPLHDDKSENPETLLFHRSSHRQLPHSSWPVPDPSSPGYPEKYTVGDLLTEHFHQLHACGFQNTGYTAIIPGYPHIILPLTDIHCLLRLHTLFQLYQT